MDNPPSGTKQSISLEVPKVVESILITKPQLNDVIEKLSLNKAELFEVQCRLKLRNNEGELKKLSTSIRTLLDC